MSKPQPGQLGHTCLRVRDLDTALHLYHGLLGMPVVETRRRAPPSRSMAALGTQQNYLEIFENGPTETAPPEAPAEQPLPLNHFSIWVENMEELEKRLTAEGYPFTNGPIRRAPNWVESSLKVGWIKDQDGNRVELLEYVGPAEG